MTSGRRERHPRRCQSCAAIPPLQIHAGHYYNNSGVVKHVGTGHRHVLHCNLHGSPSAASSSPPEDAPANHYAFTLAATPIQVQDTPRRRDRGKDRRDDRQLPGTVRRTSTHS
jgi:hypothetical protein